jgi:hypothetical protein
LASALPKGEEGYDLSAFTFEMPIPGGQSRTDENF